MIEHDEIILNHLRRSSGYKKLNITQDSIVNKTKFNQKQFEYLCLASYENFMRGFYRDDLFQVRLLDHQSINGVVFVVRHTNYSVIHWGSISTIYEKALKLTENRDFFPACFSTKNWRPISDVDISPEDKKLESKYRKVYLCGTNDQVRRDLAALIATFSWLSTIFHEAGHILHGHLGYLMQEFNEDSLIFYCDYLANDEKAISRKTLEKDADEFAGNRIIENAFNSDFYLTYYSDIVCNKKSLLEVVAAGITLKFLSYGIDSSDNQYYLPNAFRIINILDAGLANLSHNNYFKIEKDEYHSIIIKSIKSTIKSYNNSFSNKPIDEELFIKQLFNGHRDDLILKNKWNEIRPILNKYKHTRIELPPLF